MASLSKINLYHQKLKKAPPYFEPLEKDGPEHKPTFRVSCTFEGLTETGDGTTFKAAKENAASKIVELLDLDSKLSSIEQNASTYSVESYGVPLSELWEDQSPTYTLTLKKKTDDVYEYKNFTVTILHQNPTSTEDRIPNLDESKNPFYGIR
jgi:hypothetical protein